MEYINSRKRLSIQKTIFWNDWILQYRVKTKHLGYVWVTVARCPVEYHLTINQAIVHLQSIREHIKWFNKGFVFFDI